MKVNCPHCGSPAVLKDAFAIYRRMGLGMIYQCSNLGQCDAYIGVHDNTTKPTGSLANHELRELRKCVHAAIDPMWRDNRRVERSEIYEALGQVLGVTEFCIEEMREADAHKFLSDSQNLLDQTMLTVHRNRLIQLSPPGSENLLSMLRHLYVGSQQHMTRALSYTRYKGYMDSFKAGMAAGLVRRIKKQDTSKVFYVLTPAGCSAIGIEPI